MTDRPLSLVTTATIAEEKPAEQVGNAIQTIMAVSATLRVLGGDAALLADDLDSAQARLRRALEDLRHQLVVQPITEDPYGEPVRLLKPEPAPIGFGEEQDD